METIPVFYTVNIYIMPYKNVKTENNLIQEKNPQNMQKNTLPFGIR